MSAALVTRAHALKLLAEMVRIRRFEEKCVELYQAQKIRGFLHLCIGEEAVAVGAIAALRDDDAVLATYREHGHALARGLPMDRVMAELYGKAEGCSGGRGGSMHLFDVTRRFFGGNAIVGGHLPVAVGVALGEAVLGTARVTACFFGEGAVAEGEFHEALNLAALWKLPVVFLCENNGYAMGTALARSQAVTNLIVKAESLGVPGSSVDGMDVLAVEAATRELVEMARGGGGPRFLELRTYRFSGHSMFDAQLYRSKEEVARWQERDPIRLFQEQVAGDCEITEADLAAVEHKALQEVDEAVTFAEAGAWEPVENLTKGVTTPRSPSVGKVTTGPTVRLTFREALKAGIVEAVEGDPRVLLMGEDVGKYGGCYAVTKGLLDRFGPERIRDTPLSESGFVGAAVGAAMAGLRPIVEVMTVNFSLLALDQIVNNAATLRHMSGGQLSVPIIVRMATGAGRQLAAQHSHSLEGWYAHVPGLRVLMPATVADARGMLVAALGEPDPVILFEHVGLYNTEGELAADAGAVDIDHAVVRRAGRDVTAVTYGGCLPKVLAAAEQLAAAGGAGAAGGGAGSALDVEVIDLRVLRPLDTETVLASVRRTGRAVVVDEGWKTGGLSAELAALIAEGAFWTLDAPIERVCTAEVPIPYPKHLEDAALPQIPAIVAALRRACGRG